MFWILACSQGTQEAPLEALEVPSDPAATGVEVGVRTVVLDSGTTLEVWYPAASTAAAGTMEVADFMAFVPQAFVDHVGSFTFPEQPTIAYRDAPVRNTDGTFPIVVFSHGLGGVRLQSFDYTTHLASRGYVVIAPDHPGRMMTDLLPCIFTPALEGCDLSGFTGADPGVETVQDALTWVEAANTEGAFAGRLDLDNIGMSGHSAGGGTTITLAEDDTRFDAALVMAAGGVPDRDLPRMLMGGNCDAYGSEADFRSIHDANPEVAWVNVLGAGHLAFSDLCGLELLTLAEDLLADRDDLNQTIYNALVDLATDGCPDVVPNPPPTDDCADGYLDLSASEPIIRGYATQFFDETLYGGAAISVSYEDAELY